MSANLFVMSIGLDPRLQGLVAQWAEANGWQARHLPDETALARFENHAAPMLVLASIQRAPALRAAHSALPLLALVDLDRPQDVALALQNPHDEMIATSASPAEARLRAARMHAIAQPSHLAQASQSAQPSHLSQPSQLAPASAAILTRQGMIELIEHTLRNAAARNQSVVLHRVLFEGLAERKSMLGTAIGERIGAALETRIGALAAQGLHSAQLSEEEFILLESVPTRTPLPHSGNAILAHLQPGLDSAGERIKLETALTTIVAAPGITAPDTLIAQARAPKSERETPLAAQARTNPASATIAPETVVELKNALLRDQLSLQFQPQIALKDSRICGFETFLRWQKPGHGLLSAAAIIPTAEAAGLLDQITAFVLTKATEAAMSWQNARFAPFRLAINVGTSEIRDGSLLAGVDACLARTAYPAHLFDFEIVQDSIERRPAALGNLAFLRDKGVSLTLELRQRLGEVDVLLASGLFGRLKLSMAALALPESPALIARARQSGITVIVGGVENPEQVQKIRLLGCDEAQGYYFSVPQNAADLARQL